MILRKPYAFLIKKFKLLHVFLTALFAYSMYKTTAIIKFFEDYIAKTRVIDDKSILGELLNISVFIVPFLIILFATILLVVMINKKKPFLFYIFTIIAGVATLVIYNTAYDNIVTLQANLIDIRVAKATRDLLLILFLSEIPIVVFSFVRATGFDIRKFNFVKDLAELAIEKVDNEEFEVGIEVDTNKIKRRFRRRLRYMRYVYVENKLLINIVMVMFVSILGFIIYFNRTIYNISYDVNQSISTNNFLFRIDNTYITNKSYNGRILDKDSYLVVVDLNIKSHYQSKLKLGKVAFNLKIGDKKYYHTAIYRDRLFDLGEVYNDQIITPDVTNYLLVFTIPEEDINKKMALNYINEVVTKGNKLVPKYITVQLDKNFIDDANVTKTYNIRETIPFNDSVFGESKVKISDAKIAYKFKNNYLFCVSKTECYDSVEYVKPNVINNYDKVLLRLTGNISGIKIKNVYNLYSLVDYFGVVRYTLDNKVKEQKASFRRIAPVKSNKSDVYYIEILKEIEDADKISLLFKIRGNTYEYVIK